MPIDSEGKRRDVAATLREKGLLVTVETPSFDADGFAQTPAQSKVWGLLEEFMPSKDQDIRNADLVFTLSALVADTDGNLTDTVLEISDESSILWKGRTLPVVRTGLVAPAGETIMYDGLIAGVRKYA